MGKRHRLNFRHVSPEHASYGTRIVSAHEVHQGKSMRETACLMNCGKSSVHRYVERFAKTGDVQRKNYVRSPTVITDEFKQTLVTLVESKRSNPYGCPGFKWVYKRLDRNLYPCGLMTVKRALKKMGYVMKTMIRKPVLTPLHKEVEISLLQQKSGETDTWHKNGGCPDIGDPPCIAH